MAQVTVRTPVHPSEDADKVRRAVLNLFPAAQIELGGGELVARTESLAELRRLIWKQKILDAARKTFLRGLAETRTRGVFHLSKQAAFRGRVTFSVDPGALGDLEVTVEDPRLEALLKEMAPMTLRGIPISEERAEATLAERRARKHAARAAAAGEVWAETDEAAEDRPGDGGDDA